jgi:hypothetical protein
VCGRAGGGGARHKILLSVREELTEITLRFSIHYYFDVQLYVMCVQVGGGESFTLDGGTSGGFFGTTSAT